jgi:hypothetical protein
MNGGKMVEEDRLRFTVFTSHPFCSLEGTLSHPFPRNGPGSLLAVHYSLALPQDRNLGRLHLRLTSLQGVTYSVVHPDSCPVLNFPGTCGPTLFLN